MFSLQLHAGGQRELCCGVLTGVFDFPSLAPNKQSFSYDPIGKGRGTRHLMYLTLAHTRESELPGRTSAQPIVNTFHSASGTLIRSFVLSQQGLGGCLILYQVAGVSPVEARKMVGAATPLLVQTVGSINGRVSERALKLLAGRVVEVVKGDPDAATMLLGGLMPVILQVRFLI
jgi:hypothetical protein